MKELARRALGALSLLASVSAAHAESALIGGAGISEFRIAEDVEKSFTYNLQFIYTTIWGGQNSGGMWFGGLGFSQYDGPGRVAGKSESFGVFDFSGNTGVGWRIGPAALMLIVEGRYPTYANNENESGSGSYVAMGGGLRLRLGPAGSFLAPLYAQGSYLLGSASVNELAAPGVKAPKKNYDIDDLKVRLGYGFAKSWTLFVEGRRTHYDAANSTPTAEPRRIESVTLNLGRYF